MANAKNPLRMLLRLNRGLNLIPVLVLLFLLASLQGCAHLNRVEQKDREFLSDPILHLIPDPMGSGMESHNLPRREGSAGGSSGSGGGCGC